MNKAEIEAEIKRLMELVDEQVELESIFNEDATEGDHTKATEQTIKAIALATRAWAWEHVCDLFRDPANEADWQAKLEVAVKEAQAFIDGGYKELK